VELPTDKRILITATRQWKTGFMERIQIRDKRNGVSHGQAYHLGSPAAATDERNELL
jgi:hypothetical protein